MIDTIDLRRIKKRMEDINKEIRVHQLAIDKLKVKLSILARELLNGGVKWRNIHSLVC